jgi:hypothetical protein
MQGTDYINVQLPHKALHGLASNYLFKVQAPPSHHAAAQTAACKGSSVGHIMRYACKLRLCRQPNVKNHPAGMKSYVLNHACGACHASNAVCCFLCASCASLFNTQTSKDHCQCCRVRWALSNIRTMHAHVGMSASCSDEGP